MGEIKQNLVLVKKSHLEGILTSLWHLDNEHLKIQLQGVLSLPGIRYVEVDDNLDRQIISLGVPVKSNILSASYPLEYKTSVSTINLGRILVVATLDDVYQKIYMKIFLISITQFLKTLIVTILIYFSIKRILIKPLLMTATHVGTLDFRKNTQPLKLQRGSELEDELDILVRSVNHMQESLFQSYEELNNFNTHLEEKVKANTAVIIEQRGKLEYTTKMSALGEMAGGIAHEINTPLTVIQLSAEQLLENVKSESPEAKVAMQNGINRIIKTVTRISKIISGLRSFARDSKDDTKKPTWVSEIVEDTFSLCREKLSHNNVELKYISEKDVKINCRPIELSQVLLNLLNNAYDAIQDCSQKWITVEVKIIEDECVHISVIDCGRGIPLEIQEKIMQPFFTTKEVGKGTGLGLSISKGIVEAHGGKILIDNTSPNTKITISLPIAKNI
jgi:signal transduction histidine kinase